MDAVILDVGGVLLVPHHETVAPAFEPFDLKLDAECAQRAHFFGARAIDTVGDDEREVRDAYLKAYAQAVGVPEEHTPRALEHMWQAWSKANIDIWRQQVSGSRDGLRRLSESGVKLGIVSNSDGTVEEQLKRWQICQVGEGLGVPVLAIIDSSVVGVSKPAREIFRHALEPIDVAPELSLYVGDTVRYDVNGARAAGLVPVHFDPYELCPDRADHAHVDTLGEVVELL